MGKQGDASLGMELGVARSDMFLGLGDEQGMWSWDVMFAPLGPL